MTSVEPTAPTFSQSGIFFSIYGYDENIISTRGLIRNIKKHH